MKKKCPYCTPWPKEMSEERSHIRSYGFFYRKSDRKKVLRFFCKLCLKHYSQSTTSKCYYQKKRHINHKVARLMVSEVSLREGARVLKINRKTYVRKFIFMGRRAEVELYKENLEIPKAIESLEMQQFKGPVPKFMPKIISI